MKQRLPMTAVVAVLSALTLPGCFGGGRSASNEPAYDPFPAPKPGGVNTGLANLSGNSQTPKASDDLEAMAEQSAKALEVALAQKNTKRTSSAPPESVKPVIPARNPLNEPADPPRATASPLEAATTAAVAAPAPTIENAAAALPLDVRVERLAGELAKALRERGLMQRDPLRESAALAVLEVTVPSSASVSEPTRPRLDANRARSLQAIRSVLDSALRDPQLLGEPARFCDVVLRAIEPIEADRGLRLPRMEFCSRVDGYGQYEAMGRRLLAGRPHQAIVYAEIEGQGFRTHEGTDGPRYTVDLGQTVELYTDSDKPVLQMRRPEESITETSRNRRRDFFVLDVIDLPQTLSVGAYKLKITVRDRIGGGQVEQWLPVEVVADAKLANANN